MNSVLGKCHFGGAGSICKLNKLVAQYPCNIDKNNAQTRVQVCAPACIHTHTHMYTHTKEKIPENIFSDDLSNRIVECPEYSLPDIEPRGSKSSKVSIMLLWEATDSPTTVFSAP